MFGPKETASRPPATRAESTPHSNVGLRLARRIFPIVPDHPTGSLQVGESGRQLLQRHGLPVRGDLPIHGHPGGKQTKVSGTLLTPFFTRYYRPLVGGLPLRRGPALFGHGHSAITVRAL